MTVELHGSSLKALSGLFSAGPGLTATVVPTPKPDPKAKSKPDDPDTVRTVRVLIAADAPLGPREVRAFDRNGVSNVKMFQVGQWPEIVEAEPNDSPETLQPIPLPVTINGQIERGSDQDCFKFMAKAGQRIVCEIRSERLLASFDDSWLKGFMEVLGPSGSVIADNSGRFHWDPVIEFTAPADGEYVVRFRDLLWRGNPAAVYRLTVGPIPYADAVFPPGGPRGSTVQATFLGSNLGERPSAKIALEGNDPDGVQEVRYQAPAGATNSVVFQATEGPERIEREPNDRDDLAQPVPVPVTISGVIDRAGDRDCYRFHALANQRLTFEVFAERAGSPLDSFLTLRDAKGKVLEENDDARDRDSLIDRRFSAAGDYTVEIRDTNDRGGPDFTYRLRIGPPIPGFHLAATPDRLGVPAGGVGRVDVKIDREWDFNGPVAVSIEDLPPGWRSTTTTLRPGSDRALVTLEAPAAGSPAPVRVRVIGTATLDGRTVHRTAAAEETYNLQGTAYQRKVMGPVVIAADPGALTVQTTADGLALKAGASSMLYVKIRRSPGTTGPVTVKVGELPGGVKAEPVTVPADRDGAMVQLAADEDAAAAEADLLVTATVKAADGKESSAIARAMPLHLTETPTYRLAADPATMSLGTGKSASLKVKATRRGGFDGPIALHATGLPSGVTATPAELKAGATEVTLTLKAPAAVTVSQAGKAVEIRVEGSAIVGGQSRVKATGGVQLTLVK